MNLLFVYPTLFHPVRGGIERVTDSLTKEFLKRGYQVFYLHNKPDEALMDYDYPAPIFFFPERDYREDENVPFFHDFLRKHQIDIVINQCGNFDDSRLYLNVVDGVKTISVLHSTPYLSYHYLASDILKLREGTALEYAKLMGRTVLFPKLKYEYLQSRKRALNRVIRDSDKVCLLSANYVEELKSLLKADGLCLVKEKVLAIPNPNTFEVSDVDLKHQKSKTLLYVGRLVRGEKRPDRLLKIWKRLYRSYPDWNMVVVGDGPMRKELEQQSKKMERIRFVGFQSPESWYQSASIFCMTSNFEGWGMVLTEAMSYGVIPCAFHSFMSVTDVIEDGQSGCLVRPFSISEYVQKLKMLMDDEALRVKMSQSCREKVQSFSIDRIANQWETLFNSILK